MNVKASTKYVVYRLLRCWFLIEWFISFFFVQWIHSLLPPPPQQCQCFRFLWGSNVLQIQLKTGSLGNETLQKLIFVVLQMSITAPWVFRLLESLSKLIHKTYCTMSGTSRISQIDSWAELSSPLLPHMAVGLSSLGTTPHSFPVPLKQD